MTDQLREALRVVFTETGAMEIEIHSGDREPGMLIERWTIIPDVAEEDNRTTHDWATPYRGHRTCQQCGIPDTSSRASQPCPNAHLRRATNEEATAAAARVVKKHRRALDKLAKS